MIGEQENKRCPVCGGTLQENLATNPFILEPDTVVVIKDVPAEICSDCHEPSMVLGFVSQPGLPG